MNSMAIEVLHTAIRWLDTGRRVTLGTLARTWGSAPRPPGSLMVIRDDGQVAGSLSGGCIEDDLIRRVAQGELAVRLPQLTTYGASAEEAQRFGLPCGGTVQVVLEPLSARSQLHALLAAVQGRQRVARQIDLATGTVQLMPAMDGDTLQFDGTVLRTVHGPSLRLLFIGGGQLSRYLAAMLDYRVTICEPREEYHEGWQAMEGVTLSRSMPDDLALMEALRTPAFYVGALGSRRNNDARRERLQQFDVSAAEVARLRGPVGLNLGGLTPPEIALSIVAEMTVRHRGATAQAGRLLDWSGSTTACRATVGNTLVREWAPGTDTGLHTHPFAVQV